MTPFPHPFLLAVALLSLLATLPARAQMSWTVRHQGNDDMNAVAFGDGTFVAVGNRGQLLNSTNGADWKPQSVPSPGTDRLTAVAHGDGQWLVGTESGGLITSVDSRRWAWLPPTLPGQVSQLVFGNRAFVATVNGTLWSTTNLFDWTASVLGAPANSRLLAFGGGHFLAQLAAANGGNLLVSTTGSDWTPIPNPAASDLYRAVYGEGQFLVVDIQHRSFRSSDLVHWEVAGTLSGPRISALAYGNGLFAAGSGGQPELSSHATLWSHTASAGTRPIWGLAFGRDSFIAVSAGGAILQSGVPVTLHAIAPGRLYLAGPGGADCRVEVREALLDTSGWAPAGEVNLKQEPILWTDPQPESSSSRLYRVVVD